MTRKAEVFLRRYLALVAYWQAGRTPPADPARAALWTTVPDLARVWEASPKAVRETLRQLASWSLVSGNPGVGRGHRSALRLLVHPVHVYFSRAQRAEESERWAEAAFWYAEILAECPCIPGVPERLRACRANLRLAPDPAACCERPG